MTPRSRPRRLRRGTIRAGRDTMPFIAPPARAGVRGVEAPRQHGIAHGVADRADRQVAVGVDEVGVEGRQVGDRLCRQAQPAGASACAASGPHPRPCAGRRAAWPGPAPSAHRAVRDAHWRDASATAMISSSVSPSSSRQRWTCSRGGQPCHQPGRAAGVEAQRCQQLSEKPIKIGIARLRVLLLLYWFT